LNLIKPAEAEPVRVTEATGLEKAGVPDAAISAERVRVPETIEASTITLLGHSSTITLEV
jgi:hypothetical protein